ncbi:PucR family transcriptional regulator ligand-binding domain-containing protein [Saccharopolyspora sp. NPDC050389]|uniref:PucR family transcriptional regulator n=1 Tax=Saccharopolyspora sp. NPDC050389 TaxID=3155516 RepID=UPI0033DFFACD
MALRMADVLGLPGLDLRLLAGSGGLHREVRWAHVIELTDPVPWLRGGELVLTVGLGLPEDPEGQRAYVRRLADAGCAGLGFPPGEIRTELPPAVLRAADECDFPVVAAIESTPFIAITEAVAQWYADHRSHQERQALKAQDAMARAALRSGPAGIVRELAAGTGGEVLLLDSADHVRAAEPPERRDWHEAVRAAVRRDTRGALGMTFGDLEIHVASTGISGSPSGWLAVASAPPVAAHVRILANHAANLVGVGVEGVRAARAKTHQQRAAIFAAALEENSATLWNRLEDACPLPTPPYEVVALRADDAEPPKLARIVLDTLTEVIDDTALEERLVVCPLPEALVVVLPDTNPRTGRALAERLSTRAGQVHAGAATARDRAELPATIYRATSALSRSGDVYRHADELAASALFQGVFDGPAVDRFVDSVLEPLRRQDERRRAGTPSLVECVRTFLDEGQNLEAAARKLDIHRNTLRTRLRTAERVTNRSLDEPQDRLELWLATTLERRDATADYRQT